MSHFISDTCIGESCRCGAPAAHKVGEEIPFDEPCQSCAGTARTPDGKVCLDFGHLGMASRHNLTAYVCCRCFTALLGATGCPTVKGLA